jgi:hypothetical protein
VVSDTPAWFDEEPDAARRPRRRFVIVAAFAAASWLVLAAVLVRGGASAPDAATAQDVAATHGVHGDGSEDDADAGTDPRSESGARAEPGAQAEPAAQDEASPDGQTEAPGGAPPGNAATGVGREEAEALAIAVVRGWLSDGGPDLAVPGIEVDRRAYLEHVAVEAIVVPSDGLAVARTLLVLLVRDGDHYTEAVVRRAAVPLTVTTGSVHPGGPPWWLPTAPDLTPVAPQATATADPDAEGAVTAALEAAGYDQVRVATVEATDGGTLIATVAARTPAGDRIDGPVWLHPTAQGLVVLGDVSAQRPAADAPDGTADPSG